MKGLYKAFSFAFVFITTIAVSQNRLGVISEIIMASECITKPNYNLFFESRLSAYDIEKNHYWYKVSFFEDCFLKFTLVPNEVTDRYALSLYRVPKSESFCDIHEKIDDTEEQVTFKDTYQSDTFRESVVYTKVIEVSANDAIYILIRNFKGIDAGHVLEMITCNNYSYILKVTKEIKDTITTPVIASGKSIPNKLCNVNDSARFGFITSDHENITINNFTTKELDSIYLENKALVSVDSTDALPGNYSDSVTSTINPDLQTLLQNKNKFYKSDTAESLITRPQHHIAFEKIFGQFFKNAVNLRLSDDYISYLQHSSVMDAGNKKDNTDKLKEHSKRKTKKAPKPVSLHFMAINTETKSLLKNPLFRLLKESSTYQLTSTYNDSLALFTTEINANDNYKIECDLIGFKNYSAPLDLKNVIVIDNAAYYIIPMQPLKPGDKFIVPNIYFYPNLPVFREQSYDELNKLAKYLNNNEVKIIIAGHSNGNKYIPKDKRQTDKTLVFSGTAKKLSKKRAEAVRDYLIKSGVEKSRINVKGYGGKEPLIKEPKNKKEGEKNMRVEVFVVG